MLEFYDISFIYGLKNNDKISLLKLAFIAFIRSDFFKKRIFYPANAKKVP